MPDSLPILLIRGGVGTGKTCLAVALFKELLAAGRDIEFWNALDLVVDHHHSREIKYNPDAEVFVLDDLGVERTAESTDRLYDLVYPRLHDLKAMVITTAMSDEELAQRYHSVFASRLHASATFIELTGPDRRLEKADPETRRLIEKACRDRRSERGAK